MSAIEAIRARHREVGPNLDDEHYCDHCWGRDAHWPCDASLLLAALSEAEARLEEVGGHLAAVLGDDHDEVGLKERHPALWADPKYAFFTASCDRRIAARAALAQERPT